MQRVARRGRPSRRGGRHCESLVHRRRRRHEGQVDCDWKKIPLEQTLLRRGRRWPSMAAVKCGVCGAARTSYVLDAVRSDCDGRHRRVVHYLYRWPDGHACVRIGHFHTLHGRTTGKDRRYDNDEGGGNLP